MQAFKADAPYGLSGRPPTQLLTGPCAVQLRRSKEIRCSRRGMAVSEHPVRFDTPLGRETLTHLLCLSRPFAVSEVVRELGPCGGRFDVLCAGPRRNFFGLGSKMTATLRTSWAAPTPALTGPCAASLQWRSKEIRCIRHGMAVLEHPVGMRHSSRPRSPHTFDLFFGPFNRF